MARDFTAPWRRRRVSLDDLNLAIKKFFSDRPCTKFGHYLGSMLYLDFGGEIVTSTSKGESIVSGECVISVFDCHWEFFGADGLVIDSDDFSAQEALLMRDLMRGAICKGVLQSKRFVDIAFSNECVLRIETPNKYMGEGNILTFTLRNGVVVGLTSRGYFILEKIIRLDWHDSF